MAKYIVGRSILTYNIIGFQGVLGFYAADSED